MLIKVTLCSQFAAGKRLSLKSFLNSIVLFLHSTHILNDIDKNAVFPLTPDFPTTPQAQKHINK